ncbi:hypothetical protein [Pseudoalteromonas sp. DY56-GL79]|uniref:hypothetical protein n=1 Tax=Pseudoalteromonas sp. DY56-GL79 TaxID=2967131 RepID=UPI003529F519
MPPSGYHRDQANSAISFILSCARELLSEAKEQGKDIISALEWEVNNIERLSSLGEFSDLTKSVFQINKEFYKAILAERPAGYEEYMVVVDHLSQDYLKQLLEVEEIGLRSRRDHTL